MNVADYLEGDCYGQYKNRKASSRFWGVLKWLSSDWCRLLLLLPFLWQMSTFKTTLKALFKQTHSVSKYVIEWPPATIIDELHLFANKYTPYHCHVSNQVNAWVNKSAQWLALAAISARCRWRPSTANMEGRPSGELKWQSSSLVVLPHFQRATVINKLNFEIELYRSQLSVSQMLSQDKISAFPPWNSRKPKHCCPFG